MMNATFFTMSELTRLFKQEYKRWGKKLHKWTDQEAVFKDRNRCKYFLFYVGMIKIKNLIQLQRQLCVKKIVLAIQEFAVEGKIDLVPSSAFKKWLKKKLDDPTGDKFKT